MTDFLTPSEAALLTAGASMWETVALTHAGIPSAKMADGPMGIASGRVDERDVALLTPCPTALGASWDVDLVRRVGAMVGHDAARLGVDMVLAPNLNLPRSPLVGRSFEFFSEDPFLTGSLGVAWLDGLQSTGTGAIAKHLVCNDSETERNSMNVLIDERSLREVYLVPFEMAAQAGAAGMLAAYNRVNGDYCAENHYILTKIVRHDWGFDGLLVSDWFGTVSAKSLEAGLSIEMPGPGRFLGGKLGDVDQQLVRNAADHVARAAVKWTRVKAEAGSSDEVDQLLIEAAAAGFTLLKNDRNLLPLVPGIARRIAVIGPNATAPCYQGGTFAKIAVKPDAISPLDALRQRFESVAEIVHEPGVNPSPRLPPMIVSPARLVDDGRDTGMTVDYFDSHDFARGPIASETRDTNNLTWFAGMHDLGAWDRNGGVRVSGVFMPERSGTHRISVGSTGSVRAYADGQVLLASENEISPADIMGVLKAGDCDEVPFELVAGEPVTISIEFRYSAARAQGLWYGISSPDEPEAMLARAVALATGCDAVILIVGETSDSGVESKDRTTTRLDDRQVDLIDRITSANSRTAIIANVGHAFDTSWDRKAAALMIAWYPGQEFGRALADVIAGDREPGGRMPLTIGRTDADYPAFDTTPNHDGDLPYAEGTRIGYRGISDPRHALGAGFGYARFTLSDAAVDQQGDALRVMLNVRNISDRAGSEVVQVYRHEPEITLVGFGKIRLGAGASGQLAIDLSRRRFMTWNDGWTLIGSSATLAVGRSATDLPIRLEARLD